MINVGCFVKSVKRLNNMINVIISRYKRYSGDTLDGNDIYKLLILAASLHDIGKIGANYQNPNNLRYEDSECKASFKYHEIISGTIIAEALTLPGEDIGINDIVKTMITLSVLNHHYALRDLKEMISTDITKLVEEIIRTSGVLTQSSILELERLQKDLSNILEINNQVSQKLITRIKEVIRIGSDQKSFKSMITRLLWTLRKHRAGYRFVVESINNYPMTNYFVSIMTGIINVSDNIVAFCERGGSRGEFAESLLKELNLSCKEIMSFDCWRS